MSRFADRYHRDRRKKGRKLPEKRRKITHRTEQIRPVFFVGGYGTIAQSAIVPAHKAISAAPQKVAVHQAGGTVRAERS